MNEKQEKVIAWIQSGMNKNEGIRLLMEVNSNIAQHYVGRNGCETKVTYEILKAVALADISNWKDRISEILSGNIPKVGIKNIYIPVNPSVVVVSPGEEQSTETIETIKPLSEYPQVIRRIINEYAELFQERSKLHTSMAEMPESNADSVCRKRAELFGVIKSISVRLEELYNAKTEFEKTGTLPETNSLYPETTEPIESKTTIQTISMDEIALKKQKKNLQSSNSKDHSILDYQSKSQKGFKNPMPKGPKRIKIEMRIQERKKLIEDIEMMLLRPSNQNVSPE